MTTDDPAGVAIGRLTGRAEKARSGVERAWADYNAVPGAKVSLEEFARAWDACDRLRLALVGTRDAQGLLALLTEEIGPLLPRTASGGAEAVVDGVGRLVRHGKRERVRWAQDRLVPDASAALGALIADDPAVILADAETGETHPPSEIARRATDAAVRFMAGALGATPSKAWNVGAMAALGLDPADYRTSEFGGWSLEVERGVVDVSPEAHTVTDDGSTE